MTIEMIRGWRRGVGPAWVGGLAVGALMGWAILTQSLIALILIAFLWVGWALQSRQAAALGGLVLGQGGASFVLSLGTTGQVQAPIWIAVSLALLAAGAALSLRVRLSRYGPSSRMTGFWTSAGIVAVAVALGLVVALVGLPLRPGEYALPTRQTLPGWLSIGCAGVGLDAVVHGDSSDTRLVWLDNRLQLANSQSAARIDVIWPAGYRARFTPQLEILDGMGNVVLREGDAVTGACGWSDGPPRIYSLAPPFK
jgi:hypothetical protein